MKDAIYEKDAIVNQNKSNQKQVSEMSLRSKAELMLTNNKLTDLGNEIDQLQRQYQDKNKQFIGVLRFSATRMRFAPFQNNNNMQQHYNQTTPTLHLITTKRNKNTSTVCMVTSGC